MAGATFATAVASTAVIGIAGWRFAFIVVAIVSAVVGVLMLLFGRDMAPQKMDAPHGISLEMRHVCGIKTFQILIAQGVFGSMPWVAIGFLTLWLETTCFTHGEAALLNAVFSIARAVGAGLGGIIGDQMAVYSPDHGRPLLAQCSIASGFPLCVLIFYVLPRGSQVFLHVAVFATMGLTITYCGPGVNSPIFSEIVPSSARTTIFALDRMLEGAVAAFAAPLVGFLAERVFGWQSSQDNDKGEGKGEGGTSCDPYSKNATALTNALFWTMTGMWTVSFLFYAALHWSYARDRDDAASRASMEQQPESDGDGDGVELLAMQTHNSTGGV
jgi:hypothetical protein